MAFFGGFANKVAQTFTRIKSDIAARMRSSDVHFDNKTTSGTRFTIETHTADAQGAAQASILVYLDGQVKEALAREIGEVGLSVVKDALKPIKRTGSLSDSFKYKYDASNNAITIYSELPAASAIQRGIKKTGSTQALQEWLRTKPEHRGKSDVELKRLAFNIRRKIERGDSPGTGSTLRNLAPQGERRYDYLGIATKQLEERISIILNGAAL